MEPTAFLLQRTLIVTAVVLSVSSSYAPAQPGLCGKEIKTADVNGVKLSYFECGIGEPVVFVHGGFGSLRTWNGQVDEFAKEFRVISYSRRYHIPNAAPDVGETAPMQVHVEDLAALIRGLDTGPAHVVGHSYGALIAVALALQHPDIVRSRILGEPPVPSWSTPQSGNHRSNPSSCVPGILHERHSREETWRKAWDSSWTV